MHRLVLLLLPILLLVAFVLLRPGESDREAIERLIAEMAQGFDEGDVSDCVDGLHDDFVEPSTGATRDELERGLRAFFLRSRNRAAGRQRWRVEVPPEELLLFVDPVEPPVAEVSLLLRFRDRDRAGEPVEWEVEVEGELEKDGGRWTIRRAEARTVSGRAFGR